MLFLRGHDADQNGAGGRRFRRPSGCLGIPKRSPCCEGMTQAERAQLPAFAAEGPSNTKTKASVGHCRQRPCHVCHRRIESVNRTAMMVQGVKTIPTRSGGPLDLCQGSGRLIANNIHLRRLNSHFYYVKSLNVRRIDLSVLDDRSFSFQGIAITHFRPLV